MPFPHQEEFVAQAIARFRELGARYSSAQSRVVQPASDGVPRDHRNTLAGLAVADVEDHTSGINLTAPSQRYSRSEREPVPGEEHNLQSSPRATEIVRNVGARLVEAQRLIPANDRARRIAAIGERLEAERLARLAAGQEQATQPVPVTSGNDRLPSQDKFLVALVPEECPICYCTINNPVKTDCGHAFCLKCAQSWFCANNTCPSCRKVLYEPQALEAAGRDEEATRVWFHIHLQRRMEELKTAMRDELEDDAYLIGRDIDTTMIALYNRIGITARSSFDVLCALKSMHNDGELQLDNKKVFKLMTREGLFKKALRVVLSDRTVRHPNSTYRVSEVLDAVNEVFGLTPGLEPLSREEGLLFLTEY